MALVGYDNEVFISYSHIDNEPFGDPGGGWVDIFHEQLQNFVNVHLGHRTKIWRDRRLTGGEVFSAEIEEQLKRSASLVSVISPGYLKSEWCSRELVGFTEAARDLGNLRVGNLQRVIKVLRLPVDRSLLPPILDEVLGRQFYRIDPASGVAKDLLLDERADALRTFRARVDDVAQDLSRLLGAMAATKVADAGPASSGTTVEATPSVGTVFLAWTTSDLAEEREKLRRELEARQYKVVPAGAPPIDALGVRERIVAALKDAKLAVHLIGAHYGFVPEGADRSIVELQVDEGISQALTGDAARLFWLAPTAQARDPRLAALIERVQEPSHRCGQVDVLDSQTIESLKSLVIDRLSSTISSARQSDSNAAPLVYLVCDPLDHATVAPVRDLLFDRSLEVRLPLFQGDPDQIRSEHYQTLKECAGVLLFWGRAQESWLRNALRDLNKVFGLGRAEPYKAASLYLAEPRDPEKEGFRTHQVSIIRSDGGFEAGLRAFTTQLLSS